MNQPFCIFEKEPILFLLKRLLGEKLTPVTLGLGFFLVISLSLTLFGALSTPKKPPWDYLSYMANISWSISMLVLFPIIVGLTLRYYEAIPALFNKLGDLCSDLDQEDFKIFLSEKRFWFDHGLLTVFIIIVAVGLNAVYFGQVLNSEEKGWMTTGNSLQFFLTENLPSLFSEIQHGLSRTGIYAAVIQILLSYWILHLVWRSFIFSWLLHQFFNDTRADGNYRFAIPIEPLHPDGACGLKVINHVAMQFNIMLFLLGIYISLKVIDTLVIQNGTLTSTIAHPLFLSSYIVLAPLLFFLPLSAAHRRMYEAKTAYLKPLADQRNHLIKQASTEISDKLTGAIKELDELYAKLSKSIPVWPFNFKSMEAFFVAIITPFVPTIISILGGVLKAHFNI